MTSDDAAPPKFVVSPSRILLVSSVLWTLLGLLLLTVFERPRVGPSDGVAHVVMFAGVAATTIAAARQRVLSFLTVRRAVMGLVGLAVSSELLQAGFFDRRGGSVADVVLNLVGVAIGAAAIEGAYRLPRPPGAWAVALGSVSALVVISGFVVVASVLESPTWRCRGVHGSPIEQPIVAGIPGPMLEYDGGSGRWRSETRAWTQDGGGGPDAAEAWCASMRSGEFTVALVVDGHRLPRSADVGLVGAVDGPGGHPNFEIRTDESGEVVVAAVVRRPDRPVVELTWRNSFRSKLSVLVLQYSNGYVLAYVDGWLVDGLIVTMRVKDWSPNTPIVVGDGSGPTAPESPVRYVAYFGRGLSAAELRQVFRSLPG